MAIIITQNLSKKFDSLIAVNNISLEIQKGEVFGLLGPNGAGKTTFISILSTILSKTTGKAFVNGFDVEKDASKVRQSIGIVFQDPSVDIRLTARQNLFLHGLFYKMEKKEIDKRINFVLKLVDLHERENDKVGTFSGGMKRRLELARGLMHKPKILFLDEPTIGLDPQTRKHIWKYIKKINKEDKITIILTTHYMEEADFLAQKIAIIDKGKIVVLDTPKNLKKTVGGEIIHVFSSNSKKLQKIFTKNDKFVVKYVGGENSFLHFSCKNAEKMLPQIIRLADKNSIKISSIEITKPTLEDAFVKFTGKGLRDEQLDSKAQAQSYYRNYGKVVR